MSREAENTVLLLVGLSVGLVTLTGAFTRYVKPALLPWLVATAVLLVGLALVAIIGDIRRGGPAQGPDDHSHGHSHHTRVVWLLVVPVVVLIFVTPPALRPQAASVTEVSQVPVTSGTARFPPLPPGRAPEVSLPEVLVRSAHDTSGSLTNRLITITGFVLDEPGGVDLGRIVIVCCAADARLARIHLAGESISHFVDNTWLRVEGFVETGVGSAAQQQIPTLHVVTVTRVEPPANQYA